MLLASFQRTALSKTTAKPPALAGLHFQSDIMQLILLMFES